MLQLRSPCSTLQARPAVNRRLAAHRLQRRASALGEPPWPSDEGREPPEGASGLPGATLGRTHWRAVAQSARTMMGSRVIAPGCRQFSIPCARWRPLRAGWSFVAQIMRGAHNSNVPA